MKTQLLRQASTGPLGERLWIVGRREERHAKVYRRPRSALSFDSSSPWLVTCWYGPTPEAGGRNVLLWRMNVTHPHIGVGQCPVCRHYGADCTGEIRAANVYSNSGALIGAHRDELEAVADAIATVRASGNGAYVTTHDGLVIAVAPAPAKRIDYQALASALGYTVRDVHPYTEPRYVAFSPQGEAVSVPMVDPADPWETAYLHSQESENDPNHG